jgi:hypothetical protein
MRRFALAALAGMIAAMSLATTTSGATFDPHFTVIAKIVSVSFDERDGADVLHLRFQLRDELDLSDKVGHATGKCRVHLPGTRKSRCRAETHLNGEVGGRGDLVNRGNEHGGTGDSTFNIVDGSGDFGGGIAGKLVVHPYPGDNKAKWEFDLVR